MKAYSEYKDSGVEWLGNIPIHWEVAPCRAIVENVANKNENGAITNYLSLMANIGIIRYEDKGDIGNKKPDDLSKCKIVKKGNLVINSMNYAIGSYGISPYDGICSPVYIVLKTKKQRANNRYTFWLFDNKPMQKHFALLGNGILEHRAAIKWDDIKAQHIAIPPINEQEAIAQFLDYETARIDKLIAEKQTFINLLNEKRQALISHIVTKGLNPDVKMKDSGIEWIGEIPEHWRICLLKYNTSLITDGAHISPETEQGKYPFISIRDLIKGEIDFDNCLLTSEESYNYLVKTGCKPIVNDILFSKDGTVGKTAIVLVDKDFVVASSLVIIRLKKNEVTPDFFDFLCQSWIVQEQVLSSLSGAALKRLSLQNLMKIYGIFPPINEQNQISKELKLKTSYINKVINETVLSINLLKEHRTSLISTAVTGKIDIGDYHKERII